MPPKKAKSGKKGKKGKKSAGKVVPEPPKPDPMTEQAKDFFSVQFKDLEDRLAKYQARCDELEVLNTTYNSKFDQLTSDRQDIVQFLKGSLEKRGEELADMSEQRVKLQQAKDEEKEAYESQLQQLKTEFQETKETLTTENMVLNGKLASLEEFKVQKEELMKKFEAVHQEKIRQEQEQKDTIYELERRAVIDKDRLKKDMVMRVNDVAAEFRKVSNKQMAETTKRTIRENVSFNAQLASKSDKTMELIKENDALRDREKRQRQQIELLEFNDKELAKKLHSNQKIIRKLTEQCKEMEATIAELAEREEEFVELDAEQGLLRGQANATREDLEQLEKEAMDLRAETSEQQREMSALAADTRRIEQVLADTTKALQLGLQVAAPDENQYRIHERRDVMLQNLLSLLTSAAALGVGPSPGLLGKQYELQLTSSTRPAAAWTAGFKSHTTASSGDDVLQQRLGKLGLVPRPKSQGHLKKSRALSPTTRLGALKRVLTKSVSTQTASAPRAMFFADELLSQLSAQRGSGSARAAINHAVQRAADRQPAKVF